MIRGPEINGKMIRNTDPNYKFLDLFDLPKKCEIRDFDRFVANLIASKVDKNLALRDLDQTIGNLSNFVLLLSVHFKQNYMLVSKPDPVEIDEHNYTKQEVARKFRVNRRTVTNWIYAGLKTIEIGGVCRINERDIQEFIKTHRTKKFAWPSTGKEPYKKAS